MDLVSVDIMYHDKRRDAIESVAYDWMHGGATAILRAEDWAAIKAGEKPELQPKGPGDHYHDVIAEHTGAEPSPECSCRKVMRDMNQWGVEECRVMRDDIIRQTLKNAKHFGLHYRIALSTDTGKAIAQRRLGDWFDEAMARAEATDTPPETPPTSTT